LRIFPDKSVPGVCRQSSSTHEYPLPQPLHAVPVMYGRSSVTLPSVCKVLYQKVIRFKKRQVCQSCNLKC